MKPNSMEQGLTPPEGGGLSLSLLVLLLIRLRLMGRGRSVLRLTVSPQIILGLLVNIIEDIDPASVPPTAAVTLKMLARTAAPPVPQKHFRAGQIPASTLKAQFEVQWLAVTGQKAA